MGYLGLPDKTESTLDTEGWLHSGDIAQIDDKGYVVITGRIKVKTIKNINNRTDLSNNDLVCSIFVGIINYGRWRKYTSSTN